jgi:hypothetical protein
VRLLSYSLMAACRQVQQDFWTQRAEVQGVNTLYEDGACLPLSMTLDFRTLEYLCGSSSQAESHTYLN